MARRIDIGGRQGRGNPEIVKAAASSRRLTDGRDDAMLGAEALRPVRLGDDLQVGSTLDRKSLRKPTCSQRLAADRLDRYEAMGHRVLAWALAPTAVGIVAALIKGWL